MGLSAGAGVGPGFGGVGPGPGLSEVGVAGLELGVERPATAGSAIGGSNAPRKSETQVAHSGSNVFISGGNDSCGVQVVICTCPNLSVVQLAVQIHLSDAKSA